MARNDSATIRRSWRWAWLTSISIHATVMISVLVSAWLAPIPDLSPPETIRWVARWSETPSDARRDAVWTLGPDDPQRVLPDPDDPRWKEVIAQQSLPPQPSQTETPSEHPNSFVQSEIQRSIERGQRRSPEENLLQLSQLRRKLADSSSESGVDGVAEFLGALMGERVAEPIADSSQREIELSTAQIHRVRREPLESTGWQYVAVLIDRHGVTSEVELDADLGEQLYRTMRLIESNPLLERLYRKLVMGFLDQVLAGQGSVSKPPPDF